MFRDNITRIQRTEWRVDGYEVGDVKITTFSKLGEP